MGVSVSLVTSWSPRVWVGLSILSGMLTSCSILDQRSPEEIVQERANLHLAALRSAKWEEALQYTTPAFQQSAQARRYGAMYSAAPTWRKAEIYSVTCDLASEAQSCEVRTRIHPFIPPHIQANITDLPVSVTSQWLLLKGNWYRYEDR